jgi:hypothetical protein
VEDGVARGSPPGFGEACSAIARPAAALGLSRTRFYTLLRRFGLD